MKRLSITAIAVIAVAGIWSILDASDQAAAQSGSRGARRSDSSLRGTTQRGSYVTSVDSRPFEDRFWSYLQAQKYTNWAPVPGKSDGYSEGQSPHGAFLKMYLNRTAAGNPQELPNGSIIIKENYGPDKKTLMAVTVMYRTKGYNPAAGDWYWAKYNPDGTIAKMPPEKGSMKIAGKAKGCIICHGEGADGKDFAFFNDGS